MLCLGYGLQLHWHMITTPNTIEAIIDVNIWAARAGHTRGLGCESFEEDAALMRRQRKVN